jgi:hypothetical protein
VNTYNGFSPAERMAALRWVRAEEAAGRRQRPTACDVCGQREGLLERHSEDYSGPPYGAHIGAFALCHRCHVLVHRRFTAAGSATFYGYLEELEARPRSAGDPGLLRRIAAGEFRPVRDGHGAFPAPGGLAGAISASARASRAP